MWIGRVTAMYLLTVQLGGQHLCKCPRLDDKPGNLRKTPNHRQQTTDHRPGTVQSKTARLCLNRAIRSTESG